MSRTLKRVREHPKVSRGFKDFLIYGNALKGLWFCILMFGTRQLLDLFPKVADRLVEIKLSAYEIYSDCKDRADSSYSTLEGEYRRIQKIASWIYNRLSSRGFSEADRILSDYGLLNCLDEPLEAVFQK